MRYLYIDTSSSYLYTCIIEDNKILSNVNEEFGQSLSEMTLPRIESMFKKANIKPSEIDKIIAVNGPGSFTGIRIGLTIAKVYAWSMNIPIITITSLEAMALSGSSDKIHVPIINARRGYVYAAIYDKGKTILEPKHILFTELKNILNKLNNYEYISNDEFEDIPNKKHYSPNYINIVEKNKNKLPVNPHAVNPGYLKLTEAEEKKYDI